MKYNKEKNVKKMDSGVWNLDVIYFIYSIFTSIIELEC